MLKKSLAVAVVALFAGTGSAAPRDEMLVTAAWLNAHARDPNLVILFAGSKREYEAKHIPGAVLALDDQFAPNIAGGLMAEVPSPEELRVQLQALGISDGSRIVVYGSDEISTATRLLFTLDAAGVGAHASLIDGGFREWERAGLPTTTQVTVVKPGVLSTLKIKSTIVDSAFIQANVKPPHFVLIDARAGMFYDGIQQGMGAPGRTSKGHLPGARNIPYNFVVDSTGMLKPSAALQAMFRAAGVEEGAKIVVYCHVGYQATAVIFAARTLGIDARLYDGSFQDWAMRGLPVEVAAK